MQHLYRYVRTVCFTQVDVIGRENTTGVVFQQDGALPYFGLKV
jgi:hypothetical protein